MRGDEKKPSKPGFAGMTPEKRREAASKGAQALHAAGKAHQWSQEEARAAAEKSAAVRKARSDG